MRWRGKLGGAACVVLTASVLVSCGEKSLDLPSNLIWGSAHFDYYARPDDPKPCATLADVFERHFAAIETYLGLAWPVGLKVRYYKFVNETDSTKNSGCRVRGACANGNEDVLSYETFHEHELIHAYLLPLGYPPAVFQEGIAVTLACDLAEVGAFSTPISWRDAVLLNDPTNGADVYATGSILVQHLLRSYGPEPFMRLYGELAHDATPEIVDAAMQRIYGATADQIWVAALTGAPGCIPVGRCSRPEVPIDGSRTQIGDQCGLDMDRRTFSISAAANVVIGTNMPLSYKVDSCEGSRPSLYLPNATPACSPNLLLAGLVPGKYFVEFGNGARELAVTVSSALVMGPICDATTPLAIAAETRAVRIRPFTLATAVAGDVFVKLRFDTPSSVVLYSNTLGNVTACAGCDQTTPDCLSGNPGHAIFLPSVGESALKFNYAPSSSGPEYADVLMGLCAVPH